MNQLTPFTVSIGATMPASDREALLLALRSHATVQTAASKSIDWATVVIVIAAIGSIADASQKMLELVEKIVDLREKARQRGETLTAQMERPNQPPLDLATASEQEMLAWLLHQPPVNRG